MKYDMAGGAAVLDSKGVVENACSCNRVLPAENLPSAALQNRVT
jgi:hypothetical protein